MIDRVQSKSNSQTTTLSVAVTLDAAPTDGNYLIANYRESQIGVVTLPDADWHWATPSPYNGGTSRQSGIAYKLVAGDSATITFTSDTSDTKSLYVHEVSGLHPDIAQVLGPHAETASAPTSNTKTTGSTGTLPQAEMFAIANANLSGSSGGGEAVDGGFVLDAVTVSTFLSATEITAATTALNPQFSWTTNRTSFAQIATFVAAPTATDLVTWEGEGLSAGAFTTSSAGTGDTAPNQVFGTTMSVDASGDRSPRVKWTGGGTGYAVWNHASQNKIAYRWYHEVASFGGGYRVALGWTGSAAAWVLDMNFGGDVQLKDNAGTILDNTTGNLLSVDTVYRFEVTFDAGATTVAIYEGESTTPLDTLVASQADMTITQLWWGTTFGTTRGDAYADSLKVVGGTAALIGPADPVTPPSGPTYTVWDGTSEVAVASVTVWDGTTEQPIGSIEIST